MRCVPRKQDYAERCFGRLNDKLERWPIATVQQIVVDGDTAVVFFRGTGWPRNIT